MNLALKSLHTLNSPQQVTNPIHHSTHVWYYSLFTVAQRRMNIFPLHHMPFCSSHSMSSTATTEKCAHLLRTSGAPDYDVGSTLWHSTRPRSGHPVMGVLFPPVDIIFHCKIWCHLATELLSMLHRRCHQEQQRLGHVIRWNGMTTISRNQVSHLLETTTLNNFYALDFTRLMDGIRQHLGLAGYWLFGSSLRSTVRDGSWCCFTLIWVWVQKLEWKITFLRILAGFFSGWIEHPLFCYGRFEQW